jgi:ubiquinone/menaquinone biosynthesis C-methylase UbiE
MVEASIEFWRRMAAQFGGPVLELCCGAGDVATAIASMGLSVTGVDRDAAKLAQARAADDDLGMRWVQAEVPGLALPRRFGLVILAGNAFQDFLAKGEQDALLATVGRHLAPEGAFGFDMDRPAAHELADDIENLLDATGFEIVAQYGDWDFSRVKPAGARLVTLCRPRARA